ncbi:MAG: cyclic pyranopterin monophosphate synthase MoaC [Thermoanaerobaculia bacterium]
MSRALHLDSCGRARIVDVGRKKISTRTAKAEGEIRVSRAALSALREGRLAKGDALAVARIAGIQAAKRTSEIVPLCHPLSLDAIAVDVVIDEPGRRVLATASASIRAKTGVEMEALVAVSAACLAIYDMVKGIDRSAVIGEIRLLEKTGGRPGRFRAPARRQARP